MFSFLLGDITSPFTTLKSESLKNWLHGYWNDNNHGAVQATCNNTKLSGVETCHIYTVEVFQVVTKTSPDLSLALREGDQLRSVQLPVSLAVWSCITLQLLIWTGAPLLGQVIQFRTRLKPLAQWCFYSYTYSNCSFSPRTISKSNFFFNLRKIWFKIVRAKPSWSHYFARVSWKGRSRSTDWFQQFRPKDRNKWRIWTDQGKQTPWIHHFVGSNQTLNLC